MGESLKKSQNWFFKTLVSESPKKSTYKKYVRATNYFSHEERMDVYRNAYRIRLSESLGEDFSITKKLIGEKHFKKLCEKYIQKHPSRYSSLVDFSENFPLFLKGQRKFNKKISEWIVDLSLLEWLRIESRFTPRSEPRNPEILDGDLAADQILIEREPSVYLLQSHWPVHKIWRDEKKMRAKKSFVALHRYLDDFGTPHVIHTELSLVSFEILQALKEKKSLQKLLQSKFSRLHSPQVWQAAFQSLAEEKLIFVRKY